MNNRLFLILTVLFIVVTFAISSIAQTPQPRERDLEDRIQRQLDCLDLLVLYYSLDIFGLVIDYE